MLQLHKITYSFLKFDLVTLFIKAMSSLQHTQFQSRDYPCPKKSYKTKLEKDTPSFYF